VNPALYDCLANWLKETGYEEDWEVIDISGRWLQHKFIELEAREKRIPIPHYHVDDKFLMLCCNVLDDTKYMASDPEFFTKLEKSMRHEGEIYKLACEMCKGIKNVISK
jgi:hypothetical protein